DRQGLKASSDFLEVIGAGGLSGQPLTNKSIEVVKYLRANIPSEMTLVGVGGISNKEQANAMIASGADLMQLYTSFIYEGPGIVGKLV
ncbi:MAG: dihydroorotate dehydrogenase (quinone), partial [Saprospiraceae bacterium]